MSTGYDNMTVRDFSSYFIGSMAFFCYPDGEVRAFRLCRVRGNSEYEGELAREHACIAEDLLSGKELCVGIGTLVDSQAWLIHRFPVNYITVDDKRLMSICTEPSERRMSKGTHYGHIKTRAPFMDTLAPSSTPPHLQQEILSPLLRHVLSEQDIGVALAKVLSYGQHPYFKGVYTTPKRCCFTEVRDMLESTDSKTRVVVPDSHTAFILRKAGGSALFIHNGAYVGTAEVKDGVVFITTSQHKSFKGKTERAMVQEGITATCVRLLGNTVEVVFS